MIHTCGACAQRFSCNGGMGMPCTCGMSLEPRVLRRCPVCLPPPGRRMRPAAEMIGDANAQVNFMAQAAAAERFMNAAGLNNIPPVEFIPRALKCDCNKCSRREFFYV